MKRLGDGPDPIDVAVGVRIKARRAARFMSQAEVARCLDLSFQQVQKYERGANRVSASMLVKIAKILETTGAALLGESNTGQAPDVDELLTAFGKIEAEKDRQTVISMARALAESGS